MSRIKKVAIILGSLVLLAIAGLTFAFIWEGSPKEIVSVADQLRVPTTWQMKSEKVQPPRMVCLDGGSCPEVSRVWIVDGTLSKSEFSMILKDSNFSFPIEGDCLPAKNSSGNSTYLCDASGFTHGFDVHIWLIENSTSHQQKISLDVRPR